MGFDVTPNLTQDWTNNLDGLEAGINRLRPGGGTALFDAVVASSDYVTKQQNVDKKLEKKVLLVVTDGWDNASTLSMEQAVRHLQAENSPTIYTIGILDEDAKKKGRRALRALAEQTGGGAYFPRDLAEVDAITQEVARDIRKQYTIGFKKNPDEPPGYRAINVTARADGKNLTVRTKSGYFQGVQKTAKKQ